jgi:hypothetical protein
VYLQHFADGTVRQAGQNTLAFLLKKVKMRTNKKTG